MTFVKAGLRLVQTFIFKTDIGDCRVAFATEKFMIFYLRLFNFAAEESSSFPGVSVLNVPNENFFTIGVTIINLNVSRNCLK